MSLVILVTSLLYGTSGLSLATKSRKHRAHDSGTLNLQDYDPGLMHLSGQRTEAEGILNSQLVAVLSELVSGSTPTWNQRDHLDEFSEDEEEYYVQDVRKRLQRSLPPLLTDEKPLVQDFDTFDSTCVVLGGLGLLGAQTLATFPANEFWHSHAAAFHDYATNVDTSGWRMFTQFAAVSILLLDILTHVESML